MDFLRRKLQRNFHVQLIRKISITVQLGGVKFPGRKHSLLCLPALVGGKRKKMHLSVSGKKLFPAPCKLPGNKGFRVGVILAKGTNYPLQKEHDNTEEDRHLTATNKWLLGHPEGVGEGSPLGLIGRNWDVAAD